MPPAALGTGSAWRSSVDLLQGDAMDMGMIWLVQKAAEKLGQLLCTEVQDKL